MRASAQTFLLLSAFLCGTPQLLAQEKTPVPPRITAIAPLEIVPGTTATMRIRGAKLTEATAVRVLSGSLSLPTEIKAKKTADPPAGLDVKQVGDSQVEVTFAVPAELSLGSVTVSVITPGGATLPRELRVMEADQLVEETEPNGGFHEAQSIAAEKVVRGSIKEDKDVDVFRFDAPAKTRCVAEVIASGAASLLDPVLTIYDSAGHVLATIDDLGSNRDPQLTFAMPDDGTSFLTVQDAQDRGGPFHAYQLVVRMTR